jgi:uroporphyrinogen decarboxylase
MVHLGEDMAYHNASMVGPGIFERFIAPYYHRIRRLVERYRVPVYSVDTDGCLKELVHWFAACGVNLIGPNEVQAGNDIVEYRRLLGRGMAFDGGLDKRVLPRGRGAIDSMLDRVMPGMRESGGGWVAALDHRVIRGTKLDDFRHLVSRLTE